VSSRQEASDRVPSRPQTAAKTAAGLLPADPELAAVVAAWDRLPAAVKAGIVAMVQAAAK
jgi:hypothetical protein